jgi:UDP-N-acetylglucosamine 2-epimerase
MKIITIVGARPQFIKLQPLSKELRKKHEEIIIHTGQHYDFEMSKLFFDELNIPKPDYNLEVGSGTPGYQLAQMLKKTEEILIKEKPELVITFGDTNSTLAGALSAIQNHIPSAHVEAGPRNKWLDVPEMINRVIVDNICQLLFCATESNLDNLRNEGLSHKAYFVGDITYDIFLENIKRMKQKENILEKYSIKPNEYHVASCHRAENTDEKNRLKTIIEGMTASDEKIIFSLHPRTKKMMKKFNLYKTIEKNNNIIPIDPIGYLDFIQLEYHANKIITDSGGVQREAYFLKKPCINIYDHTYWPEIQDDGWQVVTGINKEKIADDIRNFKPTKPQSELFGDGTTAKKIVEIINKTDFNNIFEYKKYSEKYG